MTATSETSDSQSEAITSSSAASADKSEGEIPQCIKKKPKCQKQAVKDEEIRCKKRKGKEQKDSKQKDPKCEKSKRKKVKKSVESSGSDSRSALASEGAWTSSSEAETTADEASSAAASSTDDEDDFSGAADTESNASKWSISEDAILCSMKRGGESWAEIVESLGRPKVELKARFKVLVKEAEAEAERGKKAKGKVRAKKTGFGKGEEKEKGEKGQKKKKKAEKKTSESEESEHKEDDEEETDESDTASSQGPSEATAEPASQSDEGSEYRLQQIYLDKGIRAGLYPQRINLESDDALTQIDCEILASIDARHHHTRWLAVQASFYNTTGRMLPLDVIRQRCEAAEWEAMRRRLDEQGDGHLVEKVESWIQGVYV